MNFCSRQSVVCKNNCNSAGCRAQVRLLRSATDGTCKTENSGVVNTNIYSHTRPSELFYSRPALAARPRIITVAVRPTRSRFLRSSELRRQLNCWGTETARKNCDGGDAQTDELCPRSGVYKCVTLDRDPTDRDPPTRAKFCTRT